MRNLKSFTIDQRGCGRRSRKGPLYPTFVCACLEAAKVNQSVSFVVFGVFVTAFGATIGLTQDVLAQIGAILMIGFGLILLVPVFADAEELVAGKRQ